MWSRFEKRPNEVIGANAGGLRGFSIRTLSVARIARFGQYMRTTPQSGMNVFELMWCVLIISGAVCGARFGWAHFGTWGAVLGVPLGGGIGFVSAATAAFLLAVIFKTLFGGTVFPPRPPKADASDEKS